MLRRTPLKAKKGFKRKTCEQITAIQRAKKVPPRNLKSKPNTKVIKKLKKPKLPSISKLKKDLWKLVSLNIRKRDGIKCITCSKLSRKKGSNHAGHFLPSGNCGTLLRYHPRNIHSQCYFCNVNMGGNGAVYYTKMVEKYGQEYVTKLFQIKNQTTIQADRYFYNSLIELYKQGNQEEIIKFLEGYL